MKTFPMRVAAVRMAAMSCACMAVAQPARSATIKNSALHELLHDASQAVVWRPRDTVPPPPRLSHIFWLHFPKVGTSFSSVLGMYECDGGGNDPCRSARHWLQRTARSPFQGPVEKRARIPGSLFRGGYHETGMWFRGSQLRLNDSTLLFEQRRTVAMFRQPAQRLLSQHAFMHREKWLPNASGGWGNHADWGLLPGDRTLPRDLDVEAFARTDGMGGCQTKMLLGAPCCALRALTASDVSRALRFVETEMAFVGLQEHWALSVCLWHARFGGPLYAIELENTRATRPGTSETLSLAHARTHPHTHARTRPGASGAYDEAPLGSFVDGSDEAIYHAAAARFWLEVSQHRAEVDECAAAIVARELSPKVWRQQMRSTINNREEK